MVTGWLIAINCLIHVMLQLLPEHIGGAITNDLGFSPSDLSHPFRLGTLASLLTYQFVHGGWGHLGMNMVMLLALGPGVERPIGRARFLILYLLSGIAGALTQAVFTPPGSLDDIIGASASISGIFGALIIIWGIHRRGRRPLGIVPLVVLWSSIMAATGILGVGSNGMPVAWIAHIGGFVAGLALATLFGRRAGPVRSR
jgi:membrane associated rhomboid family serine protease